MRLIDLDQTIFVPIVDETRGGVEYEMEMTVGEFFEKFFDGCCPEIVDAIPVEWINNHIQSTLDIITGDSFIVRMWRQEQEAR